MRVPFSNRNPVVILLLMFVTCGLYYPYWLYVTTRDIDEYLGESDLPPIVHLLLFILTGTLWGFAWDFLTGQRIVRMQQRAGVSVKDDTILYLLLDFLGAGPLYGIGIVVPLLQQTRLNEVYDAARSRAIPARF